MPNYIERRRRKYYAKLTVPEDVRDVIGKLRFVQSLKTDSLAEAERRAAPLIAKWRSRIDRARAEKAGEADEWETEAASWRDALLVAKDDDERSLILDLLRDHVESQIMTAKGGTATAEDIEDLPGYQDGVEFYQVATQTRFRTLEHLEEYLTDASNTTTQKTKDLARGEIGRLAEMFPFVQDVTRREVQKWVSHLLSPDGQHLAANTVARMISASRGYWSYMRAIEVIPEDAPDPFSGLQIARRASNGRSKKTSPADQRRAFEPKDVVKLHEAAQERGDGTLADLILLAMYTGCRIEELCSLTVDRVHKDYFEITDSKTAAGWRDVPIHSELVQPVARMVAESRDGYLLSGLDLNKYGDRSNAVGKRFGRLKTAQGFDRRYVFHSIRKTVVTMFENAGVPEGVVADIVGHEKTTMTYGLYSGGATLQVKATALSKLEYLNAP